MVWVAIIVSVISAVLSIVLAPGPPKPPNPSTLDDIEAPTAEEGREIPVVFGTDWVKGPNCVWYGDFTTTERKKEGMVVGYRYFLGMHLVICQGPVDAIQEIAVDNRTAWIGNVTSSDTVTITAGGLFGGDDGEGGVSGSAEFWFGDASQGQSAYLADKVSANVPNYRGVFSVVLRGAAVTGVDPDHGHYVGTTHYLKPWAFKVKRIPAADWYPAKAEITIGSHPGHANPAHILYEVLTNTEYGMGYPTAILDDTRFRAAADTLYAEGFGMSLLWTRGMSIKDFIQEILNTIGGALRLDPVTGTFWLKLIRDDYTVGELPLLDESNVVELEQFQRKGWGETVNEITVKYRAPYGNFVKSVTLQNLANIEAQGRVVSETLDYPALRAGPLAKRICMRDLKARSAGFSAVRLRVNRTAYELGPGDVFRFSWNDLGISQIVYRIGAVSGGTLTDGAITIDAVEDVFGLGSEQIEEVDEEEWTPIEPPPDPSTLDPPAAPSDLAAASQYQLIQWTWTVNEPTAKSELWLSRTNDRAAAVKVFDDFGGGVDFAAEAGVTWYGWVRAKDPYGNYSDWVPSSATAGVEGTARALEAGDIPDGSGSDEIPKNWRLGGMAYQSPNDVVISGGKFSGISSFSGSAVGSQLQAWDADLDALASFGSIGFAVRTASDTWAQRSFSAPAAGLTITNPAGIAGNPMFALANDLAALEGLSGYGIAERTGTDAWAQRGLGVSPENLVPAWMLGSAAWQDIRRLYASTAWDPGSIADGAQTYTDVAVNGAALGDFVHVSCGADLSGLLLSGEIRVADFARIYLRNLTGAPADLSSATFYIQVDKRI
jgi:hypothetical protein